LPVVSILCPVLHEEDVIGSLVTALERIDYPPDLLDVKLLIEADDALTMLGLEGRPLPKWMEIITVPADKLRTKPRAMNYALPFCRGEIVGIYDAEDRPEPDQVARVVAHLRAAPPDVA